MIEPNSSWICQRQSAWQPHNFNYLTVNASTGQLGSMPANACSVSGLPVVNGAKIEDEGQFVENHSFPDIGTSVSTMSPYPNEHKLWKASAHETSYSQQKKFLIFDRSGGETRMIFSTLCPPTCNQAVHTAKLVSTHKSQEKLHALKSERSCSLGPDLSEEMGDYHDDTEEINALLYSSSDDLGEDEDEISTGRSPSSMDAGFDDLEEGGDFDEVTSLRCSSKRQKSLEGGSCSKLLSMETKATKKSTPKLYEDESVVNLSSSIGEQAFPNVGCKRMRRHKIHDTLRMLQKLIPGSETKDPLMIIDEAIGYLKSLKSEALYS